MDVSLSENEVVVLIAIACVLGGAFGEFVQSTTGWKGIVVIVAGTVVSNVGAVFAEVSWIASSILFLFGAVVAGGALGLKLSTIAGIGLGCLCVTLVVGAAFLSFSA